MEMSADGRILSRRTLRKVLNQALGTPSHFDAFLIDFYPAVFNQTASSMDRETKLNLLFLHVTEDPDAAWARIAPHAIHETNAYGQWAVETGLDSSYRPVESADALRASGAYAVLTPEQTIALGQQIVEALRAEGLASH